MQSFFRHESFVMSILCARHDVRHQGHELMNVVPSFEVQARIKMWHPVSWNLATQKSV